MSFPCEYSVNYGIPKDSYFGENIKLSYPNVDNLVSLNKEKGKGCSIFKVNLKRAYRQITIDPGDINFLGYKWKKHLFFDKVLPIGLRSSALICQRITNSITYILKNKGVEVINYLDDFAGAEHDDEALQSYNILRNTIANYGLELSSDKCRPPSHEMTFLGILANTLKMTLEIPGEKLQEIIVLLNEWTRKLFVNIKQVQSLVGKLNFVAKCVKPARLFISRMLEFMSFMPEEGQVSLSEEFQLDVIWWIEFLHKCNGISMMMVENWSTPDEIVACDACNIGCGGWSNGKYFHCKFPSFIKDQNIHINGLELLKLMLCLKLLGGNWRGKRIVLHCDNMTAVIVLNTGRSHNRFLQNCLREICLLTSRFECELKAVHIEGLTNRIPDLLSRWDDNYNTYRKFCELSKVESFMELQEFFIDENMFTT